MKISVNKFNAASTRAQNVINKKVQSVVKYGASENGRYSHNVQCTRKTGSHCKYKRTLRIVYQIIYNGKMLVVFRHGERIDFTFDAPHESWVQRCFDEYGRYRRTNINMPRSLPLRKDGHRAFALDTPLTEMGYLQAKISGKFVDETTKDAFVFRQSIA